MSSTSTKQPLGFFDLPPEIRLRISELSQLNLALAPLGPALGYVAIWKGRLIIPEDWRKENRPLCSICTENTSSDSSCFEGTLSHPREFAWSKTCLCCSIPLSLFIVSKQMKAEAEYTFFRYNGYEFFPTRSLDICRYLGGLTENNLRLIRDLRFIFGSQQCRYWDRIGRKDWRLLLNWIKHNQNLRDYVLLLM